MQLLTNLWKDEDGQTFVEYAVILAVISLGMIAALTVFRTELQAVYATITARLAQAPN
ncbi:MAG: Flp family type IVb pilin [Gemmatimonadetes bacterium]|nr:Flp family type IVb pilin [Gemmatimonadota bacterium]